VDTGPDIQLFQHSPKEQLDGDVQEQASNTRRKLPPSRYQEQGRPPGGSRIPRPPEVGVFEKHYSVKELSELWSLSERTIRRMFIQEPGVLEWGTSETRTKRCYKTIRIPQSVAQRVYRKLRRAG
jgi:hypothetical protein